MAENDAAAAYSQEPQEQVIVFETANKSGLKQ
jgi:hypothetical protein